MPCATSLCGEFTTGRRQYVPVALPARDVVETARVLSAGITELLVAGIMRALGRILRARATAQRDRVVNVSIRRRRGTTCNQRSSLTLTNLQQSTF
jgi:hypothetical protein